MKIDAVSGTAPFYDSAKAEVAFAKIEGITAPEAKTLAMRLQLKPKFNAGMVKFKNDIFYYDLSTDAATRLTKNADAEENEDISPDGKKVAFVRNFNLFVVEIATSKETALTTDGNAKLFNGKLDWVYQEEVYGRGDFKSYWWSPDSSKLAYLQLDEAPVKEFTVIDHLPKSARCRALQLPEIRDAKSECQARHCWNFRPRKRSGLTSVKYSNDQPIVARVGWKPDSSRVVYHVANREQTWLDVNLADPTNGNFTKSFS